MTNKDIDVKISCKVDKSLIAYFFVRRVFVKLKNITLGVVFVSMMAVGCDLPKTEIVGTKQGEVIGKEYDDDDGEYEVYVRVDGEVIEIENRDPSLYDGVKEGTIVEYDVWGEVNGNKENNRIDPYSTPRVIDGGEEDLADGMLD